MRRLAHHLQMQDGVVARRQATEAGLTDADLARLVRRRELTRVAPGVLVDHTGPLTERQRWWVGVLAAEPAALSHGSALAAHGLRIGSAGRVRVAVAATRRVQGWSGSSVVRLRRFDDLVHPARRPPRLRIETAVLQVASEATTLHQAVAVLGDACQSRLTSPARLLRALDQLPRLPRRGQLARLLTDVASGAYSALEHLYLGRVERAHGLPRGRRQHRAVAGAHVTYRDVDYEGLGVIVELDGRLGHELTEDRWADLDRDVYATRSGEVTLRFGWRHVCESCRCARHVGDVLVARGWAGPLVACGPHCTALG